MPVTLRQLLAGLDALHPEPVGADAQLQLSALASDSRAVTPGAAFLALRGDRVDGHDYLSQAADAGAALLVVERGACEAPASPHLWLDDTRAAHGRLAANFEGWPSRSMHAVGITGTNGKTTVAHLLSSVFQYAGTAHARLGTTGNWLVDHEADATFTTPFPIELQACLADARGRGATHLVMEVSSHALEQGRVDPIEFDAAAMTSFSRDHLDFHPTMEAYLEAKLRLAGEHLAPSGLAIAPVDRGPWSTRFLDTARTVGARTWAFSRDAEGGAPLRLRTLKETRAGIRAELSTPRGPLALHSPLVGDFNVDNLALAAGLALDAGIPPATIHEALAASSGAPGRLERVHLGEGARDDLPEVYVDYAHTPDAVARALAALRPRVRGKLLVVLGCGGDRDRAKRPMMGAAAAEGADTFFATSDNPRSEDPEAIVDEMLAGVEGAAQVHREVDRATAIRQAIAAAGPEDTVLIAGKGHEDYQILGDRKIDFDDREHARAAMAQRG